MEVKVKETKNNKDSCTLGENVRNGNRVRAVKSTESKIFCVCSHKTVSKGQLWNSTIVEEQRAAA